MKEENSLDQNCSLLLRKLFSTAGKCSRKPLGLIFYKTFQEHKKRDPDTIVRYTWSRVPSWSCHFLSDLGKIWNSDVCLWERLSSHIERFTIQSEVSPEFVHQTHSRFFISPGEFWFENQIHSSQLHFDRFKTVGTLFFWHSLVITISERQCLAFTLDFSRISDGLQWKITELQNKIRDQPQSININRRHV